MSILASKERQINQKKIQTQKEKHQIFFLIREMQVQVVEVIFYIPLSKS